MHAEKLARRIGSCVPFLLSLSGPLQGDAADALAIAVCHAHARRTAALLEAAP